MITPYKRPPKARPVGIVTARGWVIDEDGARTKLKNSHPDLILYADRAIAMDHVTAGWGSALRWNDTAYRWEAEGRSISLIGGYPGDGRDFLGGLVSWAAWLHSFGAGVGNVRQATRSLLRATIARPLVTDGGQPPPFRDVIGGRQTALKVPGHYTDCQIWDMTAAYASTMGELRYSGRWYHVGDALPADDDTPAFCRARVRIPGTGPGPLPRRRIKVDPNAHMRRLVTRDYPVGVRVQGIWNYDELLAARRAGCSVDVLDTWIMPGDRQPFAPWWEAVSEGRKLDGWGGRLAKATGNALWGAFAAKGERTRLSFRDGRRIVTSEPVKGNMPQAIPLAELVCSKVRVRLWSEMIEPYRFQVVSAHTDGAIIQTSGGPSMGDTSGPPDSNVRGGVGDVNRSKPNIITGTLPPLLNDLPAGWRCKAVTDLVVFLGPQAFAYRDREQMVYKLSGVPPRLAPEIFANLCSLLLYRSKRSHPSQQDIRAWRDLHEAFPELRAEPPWRRKMAHDDVQEQARPRSAASVAAG